MISNIFSEWLDIHKTKPICIHDILDAWGKLVKFMDTGGDGAILVINCRQLMKINILYKINTGENNVIISPIAGYTENSIIFGELLSHSRMPYEIDSYNLSCNGYICTIDLK